MTQDQVEYLFSTHVDARRRELWEILWCVIGSLMQREQMINAMAERIEELETKNHQTARALGILQAGHSRLYQQAQSTPRTVNSVHVRQTLLAIDHQLRSGIS